MGTFCRALPKRCRAPYSGVMNLAALISDPNTWIAFFTLVVMEVVLGIDNLVFVAIVSNRLPQGRRALGRNIGLSLALVLRLLLLGTLVFLAGLTAPLLTLFGHGFSLRDLIMISGGLFLLWKATSEIHERMEHPEDCDERAPSVRSSAFAMAIVQILVLDLVFSIDSILTAVGMTDVLPIMAAAVIVAVGLMLVASGPLAAFIRTNPTIVMLALGFLLMIGMVLIADGMGFHVPKGYIYAAMAFSGFVESLNMLSRRAKKRAANGP